MTAPQAVSGPARGVSSEPSAVPRPLEVSVLVDIDGMTCGACAVRIEKRLNRMEGVHAIVNFATERATVTLTGPSSVDDVVEAVNSTGFVATPTTADDEMPLGSDEVADQRVRMLWRRLLVSFGLFMPLCDGSLAFSLFPELRFPYWQWLMLFLALPVVTWAAWPFYRAAVNAARHRTTTMDTLVSIGIISATSWSLYSMFSADGSDAQVELYFDVAVGVTTFLLAGRFFEARAKRRAGDALRTLAAVGAKDVGIIDAHGREHRVAVSGLRVGDRFAARPGETIATDGTVVDGAAQVDAAAMTGESTLVEVQPGTAVIGGTIVADGFLTIEATQVGSDTQLAQMLQLVEHAQNEKAGVQRLADRIAAVFVPTVLAISAVTLVGWLWSGAPLAQALNAAISVLIIACPCALGLATPTAMLVASNAGARLGIFFKDYEALEKSRRIDTVLIDKTGTLTEARMSLVAIEVTGQFTDDEVLGLAGALEQGSEHPVGRAITAAAADRVGRLSRPSDFVARHGLGVAGVVNEYRVGVGRLQLLRNDGVAVAHSVTEVCTAWENNGWTVVLVVVDDAVAGVLAVADTIKSSAAQAVADFGTLGLHSVLLTGDNEPTARAVAAQVGITDVIAEALPTDKNNAIRRIQGEGRSVAMIGDGVNDAPALAAADLGLAIGNGSAAAIEAADLIIVRDDLRMTGAAIALSRKTIRVIHGNLVWAFGYNVAAIPLAAFGLLNPLVAGAAMALSSAFVVWNSSRIRRFP